MHIEKATSADIPALSELLSALFSQEEEFAPNPEAQSKGLTQIINHPETGVILLARQGEQVVGMVNLLFTVSTALVIRSRCWRIWLFLYQPVEQGSGTQLLAEAISFARSQGCRRITLLTDRTNEAAQRFYEKQGFVASSMIPMRLSLA